MAFAPQNYLSESPQQPEVDIVILSLDERAEVRKVQAAHK